MNISRTKTGRIRRTGYKVECIIGPWGFFAAEPIRKDLNQAIASYLAQFNVTWNGIYIEDGYAIEQAIEDFHLTRTEVKEMNAGWTVTKIVEPDTLLASVGYDAYDDLQLPA